MTRRELFDFCNRSQIVTSSFISLSTFYNNINTILKIVCIFAERNKSLTKYKYMKRSLFFYCFVILFSLMAVSCSTDDDENDSSVPVSCTTDDDENDSSD